MAMLGLFIRRCRQRAVPTALAVAFIAIGAWGAQSAAAQDAGALAALKPRVSAVMRQSQAPGAEEKQLIEDFFVKSFFAGMTQSDPVSLGQLAEKRKDLFSQFLNVRGSQEARDQLLQITLKAAGNMAIKNYHPAIRYNATLIIGQLDAEPVIGRGTPTPYPAGTRGLLMLLQRDEFGGVPVSPPVELAALVGLERHTRFGVDPELAEKVAAAALTVANGQEPPQGVSADVHGWMRRLAVGVLVNLDAQGLSGPTNEAINTLLSSSRVELAERCEVADLLKPAMYQGAEGLDVTPATVAVGALAKDVLAFEADKADEYVKGTIGDPSGFTPGRFGGGREFGGGYGREMGYGGRFGGSMQFGAMPMEEEAPHIERRRLVDRLAAINTATRAVGAAGSDEIKKRMTDLAALLAPVAEKATESTPDMTLAGDVQSLSRAVDQLVGQWAPAEPVVEEQADAAFGEAPAEDAAAEGAPATPPAEEAPAEPPAAEAPEAPPAPEAEQPVEAPN